MPFFDGGHSGGSRSSSTNTLPPGSVLRTGPTGTPVPAPFSGPLGQVGSQPQSLGQPLPNYLSNAAGATGGLEDPLKKQQQTGGMSAGV